MWRKMLNREKRFNLIATIVLFLISLIFIIPLYMTSVFATRTMNEVISFPPPLWFGDNMMANLESIRAVFPPLRPVWNSLIVAVP